MFTGIVREVGEVVEAPGDAEGRAVVVRASQTAASTAIGDSVSIAGVCLTAEAVDGDTIRFHAVGETLRRTTLGALSAGDGVNVEPALRAGEPYRIQSPPAVRVTISTLAPDETARVAAALAAAQSARGRTPAA